MNRPGVARQPAWSTGFGHVVATLSAAGSSKWTRGGSIRRGGRLPAARYKALTDGRGLALRLTHARLRGIVWRLGYGGVALLVAVALRHGFPLSPLTALAGGIAVSRLGRRLLLGAGESRRDQDLLAAAPALARHLATSLDAGATPTESLRAARDSWLALEHRHCADVLDMGWRLTRLGMPAEAALARACAGLCGEGGSTLRRVAAAFALVCRHGGPTLPLLRLAEATEAEGRSVALARGVVAEARTSSIAVPLLSGVTGVAVCVLWPQASTALATVPGVVVVGGCAATAAVGVVVARRLTAVPP